MRSDDGVPTTRCAFRVSPVALVVLALTMVGCGSDGEQNATTTLTVYAAASLTGTFTELGDQFEATHPGVAVSFSFGGSSDLVSQIQNGAPADVFASADIKNMEKLTDDGLEATPPVPFAANTLTIITPPDNPGKVNGLDDLADDDLAIALCAPEVPCGSAARSVSATAGVTVAPDTEEQSVKDVVAKVAAGEADAGLVYVTDAQAAADTVAAISFPEAASQVNLYPVTTIKASEHLELATEFTGFLTTDGAQAVLAAAGFAPAPR